ncbi:MAG: hypothetical protein AAB652_00415 [Patescibacteria group bacterium]
MESPVSKKILFVVVLVIITVVYLGFFFRSNRGTDLLGNPDKANQALDSAVKSDRIENCAQLRGVVVSGTDYEAVCRQNILEKQAWEKLDSGYCDTLGSASAVDYCKTSMAIAAVQKSQDLATCDSVSEGARIPCQTAYWSAKALGNSDIKLCDNISDKDFALSCRNGFTYQRFLAAPRDVACSELPVAMRGDCATFKRALQSKQIQGCYSLSDVPMRSLCLKLVGK